MEKQLKDLELFHKTYDLEFHEKFALPTPETVKLRKELLDEETQELFDAYAELLPDGSNEEYVKVKCLDALTDILYVALGAIVSFGAQEVIFPAFDEVQSSNMSKLDENGQPIVNGKNGVDEPDKAYYKILKGPNYFKPNLKKVLSEYEKALGLNMNGGKVTSSAIKPKFPEDRP